MRWTAIIPLKCRAARKSRLAGCLGQEARAVISDRLFGHLVRVLRAVPAIGRIVLLAPTVPPDWREDWVADVGRGLNVELDACRAHLGACDLLVVHPDLPLVMAEDIGALLEAARLTGVAIAADRHGRGTNAIAVRAGWPLAFRFGPDSLAAHQSQAPGSMILCRPGLALDIDTADDIAIARAGGFDLP